MSALFDDRPYRDPDYVTGLTDGYARALSNQVFREMEDREIVSSLARILTTAMVAGETTRVEMLYAVTELRSPGELRALVREAVRSVLPDVDENE